MDAQPIADRAAGYDGASHHIAAHGAWHRMALWKRGVARAWVWRRELIGGMEAREGLGI